MHNNEHEFMEIKENQWTMKTMRYQCRSMDMIEKKFNKTSREHVIQRKAIKNTKGESDSNGNECKSMKINERQMKHQGWSVDINKSTRMYFKKAM